MGIAALDELDDQGENLGMSSCLRNLEARCEELVGELEMAAVKRSATTR
jgi:hypothetical protein